MSTGRPLPPEGLYRIASTWLSRHELRLSANVERPPFGSVVNTLSVGIEVSKGVRSGSATGCCQPLTTVDRGYLLRVFMVTD